MPTSNASNDKKPLIKFLLLLAVALCLGLIALRFGPGITRWVQDPEAVRQALHGLGPTGVLAYLALQVGGVLIAVLPNDLVTTCGGYLYGPLWGFLLSWVGAMAGAVIAFYTSRLLGYDFVSRLLPKKAVNQSAAVLNSPAGMAAMLVAFLIPVFPKDVLIYMAGLTPVSAARLFLIFGLCRIPNTLIWANVGASLYKRDLPALLFTLAALVALLVGGYLLQRRMRLGQSVSQQEEDAGEGGE